MISDTPYATVRPARAMDCEAVLDVLTESFVDDPVSRWLFPDTDDRPRRFFRAQLAHAGAEAYLAGDRAGAAIWQTVVPGAEQPVDKSTVDAAFGDAAPRLLALGAALAGWHPDDTHLYLPCVGVVAEWRGTGAGSALLRHRLVQADADGLGAYLEASSPRSRALYQRHGFTDLGEPLCVADSPLLWPMWRPAAR